MPGRSDPTANAPGIGQIFQRHLSISCHPKATVGIELYNPVEYVLTAGTLIQQDIPTLHRVTGQVQIHRISVV
jgi:hypothetical protein